MGIGDVLGGYAQSRNVRTASKKVAANTQALASALSSKVQPAQGLGGTPVTNTGTPVKPAAKTLGQKIGSGIMNAGKALLGFKKGGRITKSGLAFVHSGETIIPKAKERKALRVSSRRSSR
jgi:hypothetical protein